jgi:hypothetical protein
VPAPGGRYHQTRNLKGRPIHRIHRTEHGDLRTQTHRCLLIHPAFLIGVMWRYVLYVSILLITLREAWLLGIGQHALLGPCRRCIPGHRQAWGCSGVFPELRCFVVPTEPSMSSGHGSCRASAILVRAQRREVHPNIRASLRSDSGFPACTLSRYAATASRLAASTSCASSVHFALAGMVGCGAAWLIASRV